MSCDSKPGRPFHGQARFAAPWVCLLRTQCDEVNEYQGRRSRCRDGEAVSTAEKSGKTPKKCVYNWTVG
jgi:hypothetical protein